MADEPIPSPLQPVPTEVTPVLPEAVRASSRTGITTSPDGVKGPTSEADKDAASMHIPWSSWLLNLGAQFAFAVLLAVFVLVVLWASGMTPQVAGGTAVIVAILVTSFVRHFIHWPLPKEAFARESRLPPNVRPSDSSGREVIETVVFVVVLVLLLKSFAAEAFVIPTGSMAETLYGYQKDVKCPSCGITFPVNCSNEVDPQDDNQRTIVNGCTCPNCRRVIRLVDPKRDDRQPRPGVLHQDGEYMEIPDPGWSSGDRVLVGKFFDLVAALRSPHRLDVVVFKYPEGPQKNHVAMNYIKRLIGLPGETIAIWGGDLYVLNPAKGPTYDDSHVDPKKLWQRDNMHANDVRALEQFNTPRAPGSFEIIRKPPEVLLSMRRLVYDNDHPASDLTGKQWQRWRADSDAWDAEDDGKAFRHGTRVGNGGENTDWLRYRHLLRKEHGKPTLITDFMGYNSNESWEWKPLLNQWSPASRDTPVSGNGSNWVGDLILECEVKIDKAEGELVLELVRGPDRFRARWDLASEDGVCTLTRQPVKGPEDSAEELDRQPTRLRKGTYRLRFANVDRRLTVWVDNQLPFGAGMPYDPPTFVGPTEADLQPASIGVKGGALTVRKLKLWRDTYHTVAPQSKGGDVQPGDWGDPKTWSGFQQPPVLTLYVQPGHYLCLGDNSPWSSDGRTWGLVPERLLLGRALLVYYPFDRAGRIR